MAYVAIEEADNGLTVDFLEPVTDVEYYAGPHIRGSAHQGDTPLQ